MNKKTSMVWLAAGVISLLAFSSPDLAKADARSRQKKLDQAARHEIGADWAELHNDRAELRRDVDELERDKIDLQRAYRRGGSRDEIARKRAEVRQDLGEIRQDRREIWDDHRELHRDRNTSGWGGSPAGRDNRFGNSGNHSTWGNRERFGSWDRDRRRR